MSTDLIALRATAEKVTNFIQLACPKGEVVTRAIRELVERDDPYAYDESRKSLSLLVARLTTCGALALDLIQRFELGMLDWEHAAGEIADLGMRVPKEIVRDENMPSDVHALINGLVPSAALRN